MSYNRVFTYTSVYRKQKARVSQDKYQNDRVLENFKILTHVNHVKQNRCTCTYDRPKSEARMRVCVGYVMYVYGNPREMVGG